MDDDTLKNVVPHSVATALANNVFPVPGGPTINTPFHGRLMPWKYPGIHNGSTTASSNNLLASVNPAMSSLHDGGSCCLTQTHYTQKYHTQTDTLKKIKSVTAAKRSITPTQ